MAEEDELAAAGLAVCGEGSFSDPCSDNLSVGVQEFGDLFGFHCAGTSGY